MKAYKYNQTKDAAKLIANNIAGDIEEGHLAKDFEHTLNRQIDHKVEQIKEQADRVSRNALRLIQKLEKDGPDASFNTLGEMQGAGSELDRLIGELAAMRNVYKEIGSMANIVNHQR